METSWGELFADRNASEYKLKSTKLMVYDVIYEVIINNTIIE